MGLARDPSHKNVGDFEPSERACPIFQQAPTAGLPTGPLVCTVVDNSDYSWLIGDDAAAWLRRLAADRRSELQVLKSLRRDLTADRARLLVEQVVLRERAAVKFGPLAERLFFTRQLLEQATDLWIGKYKAHRTKTAGQCAALDLCCGLGGDIIALARSGSVEGWDHSQTACLLASANLRETCTNHSPRGWCVRHGDVVPLTPEPGVTWHVDPDRRPGGRRTTRVADSSPGPEVIDRWLNANPAGAIKLAPAAEIPMPWAANAELEWITRDRECRQQVAWFGPLASAPGRRRATIIERGDNQNGEGSHQVKTTLLGDADVPCAAANEPGRFMYDPDPSVLAAGLLGSFASEFGLKTLGCGGAFLTGDAIVKHPLARGFAVLASLPLRAASLARHLASHGIGQIEIKTRGVNVAPEVLRRSLRPRGANEATLLVTRVGKRNLAIVAERLSA